MWLHSKARPLSFTLCFGLCLRASADAAGGGGVTTPVQTRRVVVQGKPPLIIDAASLSEMPHREVKAGAHHEPESIWRAVRSEDVLQHAGVALEQPLHGKELASFVRVSAADQYQVVFGLSDLDPTLGAAEVLLVDQRDGKPLAADGPFRLLVPGDKRPARWVRNVTAIEVVDGRTPAQP